MTARCRRGPSWRLGSPRLILTTLRAPRTIHPSVWASAWLPRGRGRHEALHATVAALDGLTGRPGSWADGRTWIVAVDFSTGRRVMFGRPGAPQVPLADAVVASCSIPGWYEPAVIDGRHYVDGGVRSSTSLRSLAEAQPGRGLRPGPDGQPRAGPPVTPGRAAGTPVRRLITRSLLREAEVLRRRRRSGSPCSPRARRTWP